MILFQFSIHSLAMTVCMICVPLYTIQNIVQIEMIDAIQKDVFKIPFHRYSVVMKDRKTLFITFQIGSGLLDILFSFP